MKKVYEIVKNTILDRLDTAIKNNENFEWIQPWNGVRFSRNFKTKNFYRGINLISLPYGGYYLTFNQVFF